MKSIRAVGNVLLFLILFVSQGWASGPIYIECYPDKVILHPSSITNTWEQLQKPENALSQIGHQSVILLVRPESVKFLRAGRKILAAQHADVQFEPIDADFQWKENTSITPPPNPGPVQNIRPSFFDCRNNEIFYLDKAGLDASVAKVMQPNADTSDPRQFVAALQKQPVENQYYKVNSTYLLTGIVALTPKEDVHGENARQIAAPTSQFQKTLLSIKPQEGYPVFLVRDNSFAVFRDARRLALKSGYSVTWELLGNDEPIKFGTGGSQP